MTDNVYKLITNEKELDQLCTELASATHIAVDTETEGLLYSDIIVGIALSAESGTGYYVPLRHEALDGVLYPDQVDVNIALAKLKPILETKPCVGHNVKFDMKMFWKDGIDVNYCHDTLIMAHLLGIDHNGRRGLKQLVEKFFDHKMNDIDSLFPKIKNRKQPIRPKILAPKDIEFYGCEDGNWSLQLFNVLFSEFKAHPSLTVLYLIEMKLLRVVAEMESFGVPVSLDFLRTSSTKADEYIKILYEDIITTIRAEIGDPEYEVNFKSPSQIAELLFDRLGLPVLQNTPAGKPSTSAVVLRELAKEFPIAKNIVIYRELNKLNDTYLFGLQDKVEDDGRIRGSFNQSGTASGRFSSSSPNMQNLPKDQTFIVRVVDEYTDSEELDTITNSFPETLHLKEGIWESLESETKVWGNHFLGEALNGLQYTVQNGAIYEAWKCKTRDFITAEEDCYLIEADYSQVELRIMAGESGEPTLLDAYAKGDDVHKRTAALIFDVPFEHVTEHHRYVGKTINFSLLYGAGPLNISEQLAISIDEARILVDRYFKNLPAIQNWINSVKRQTKSNLYAETALGRRRLFPNAGGNDFRLADKELRESVNHNIQGAAADVMKIALVRAHNNFRKYFNDKVKIVSTVHDSVLVECHNSVHPDDAIKVLRHSMEGIREYLKDVFMNMSGLEFTRMDQWPELKIDVKVGKSWGSSKEVDKESNSLPVEADSVNMGIRVRKIAKEREEADNPALSRWILEIHKDVSGEDINTLISYIKDKTVDEGSELLLRLVTSEGVTEKELVQTVNISKEDETHLKMLGLPCTLRQDVNKFNPHDVLKGIDFGL